MDITMDVDVHQYSGVMDLTYINHSPDVLERIPFHLFSNAFQPGSEDVRSRNIADPDPRVGDRIVQLPEEEGWIRVRSPRAKPTPPSPRTEPSVGWTCPRPSPGQEDPLTTRGGRPVPRQIRSGWMNKQGVEYSMTQWYPRLCEYTTTVGTTTPTSAGNSTACGATMTTIHMAAT